MGWLLNCVYLGLLVALSPWLLWRRLRTGRYRRGWGAKLLGRVPAPPPGDGPVIWLHAVSVGEVNLLGVLIERLERRQPGCRCVISTTTETGYDVATRKYSPRTVFFCPLDFTWAVRAASRRVRPDLLVLAEVELWPNLVRAARASGARVAIVNGRLSDHSYRGYSRIAWVVRRLLRRVDLVAAQSEAYAERFRTLGAPSERVVCTGSVKFDGARTDRENSATRRLAELAGIARDDVVLLAGSTQAPEEELTLDAYLACRERHPRLRLLLVPRHPERFDEVARLLESRGVPFARRSQLAAARPAATTPRVLLVDAVGELGAWWGLASIGYVGGSMGPRGGQNMIEPAAYGCAVSFGPRTQNFRDVVQLMLAEDAARVVQDGAELTQFVRECLDDPEQAAELGERARQLVLRQQGAADATVELLSALLPRAGVESRRAA